MELSVNTQRITIKDPFMLVTGTTGVYEVTFDIESDVYETWDDLAVKFAVFKKWKQDITVTVALDSTDSCAIPSSMLTDTEGFRVGLYGETASIRYGTIWSTKLVPSEGCIETANIEVVPPSEEIWTRILEIMEETKDAADEAIETAEGAVETADEAVETAESAETKATTAETNAAAAVTTANSANTKSDTAVATANTASTNAVNAVNTANTASANATTAVNTATEAKTLVTGITVDAETLEATEEATAEVTTVSGHYNIEFGIPKGNTGDSAGFGTPTASVDANSGVPYVEIHASGPNTAKIFDFEFHNLKGTDGDMLREDYDPNDVVADAGGIELYVEGVGGKINVIKINGTTQEIVNKTVDLILTKTTVGLGNVDNTSDLNKPVSTATQAVIDAHTGDTTNPHAVTKAQVGLGNVDNTSDADKPISTATQAALDAHTTNVNNPHAVTKAQVGLGNVDNTSDLSKPISTATQAALDAKVDLDDDSTTGFVFGIDSNGLYYEEIEEEESNDE